MFPPPAAVTGCRSRRPRLHLSWLLSEKTSEPYHHHHHHYPHESKPHRVSEKQSFVLMSHQTRGITQSILLQEGFPSDKRLETIGIDFRCHFLITLKSRGCTGNGHETKDTVWRVFQEQRRANKVMGKGRRPNEICKHERRLPQIQDHFLQFKRIWLDNVMSFFCTWFSDRIFPMASSKLVRIEQVVDNFDQPKLGPGSLQSYLAIQPLW